MTETIHFRIQHSKAQIIEEAVEAWKTNHAAASGTREAAELVRECLTFQEEMRRTYGAIFERAAAGQIDDYHGTGEALRDLFHGILRAMRAVRDWVRQLEASGQKIAGDAELNAMIEELEQKTGEIFERWPWLPTATEVAEARAAFASGDYQTVEEILHELRCKNS